MQDGVLTLFGSKTVQDGGFVQDGGVQDGVQHCIIIFASIEKTRVKLYNEYLKKIFHVT